MEFDSSLGLKPYDALGMAIKELELRFGKQSLSLHLQTLKYINFVRCGKTAVIFSFANTKEYILIFDENKKLLTANYKEEVHS